MRALGTDEKGSILPMFAVVIVLFFMVAAFAIDYARYVVASEKLLTATESAATSAALTAKRYVKLEIDRGSQRECCPSADGGCSPCCVACNEIKTITGREDQLLDQQGYKKYCCSCGCKSVKLLDRWVVYENNGTQAPSIARTFFNMNKPKEMDAAQGGSSQVTSVTAINSRKDPRYPSVIVKSKGQLTTLLLKVMDNFYPGANFDNLDASRCSQGGSFYYDVKGNKSRASKDGCN